jgi:hypothetical protein
VQRHELDVTSLVFGLVFLGAVAVWGLVQAGLLTAALVPIAVPVLLVVVGGVGMVAALVRHRAPDPLDPGDPFAP